MQNTLGPGTDEMSKSTQLEDAQVNAHVWPKHCVYNCVPQVHDGIKLANNSCLQTECQHVSSDSIVIMNVATQQQTLPISVYLVASLQLSYNMYMFSVGTQSSQSRKPASPEIVPKAVAQYSNPCSYATACSRGCSKSHKQTHIMVPASSLM